MARKRVPSVVLLVCLLGGLLAGTLPARADELQRIQELRECIDRTDPTRGQDPAWRDRNCPDTIEQAKAELARLLNQAEQAAAEAKRRKKQAEEKASRAAATQGEADLGASSGTASRTSRKTAASSPAASPALPGVAVRTAPSDPSLQTPPVGPELCAAPADVFNFAGNAAGQISGFDAPVPTFGTLEQTPADPFTLGAEQAETLCRDLFSLVPSPDDIPTLQSQLQPAPILDIEKTAVDYNTQTPINYVAPEELFSYEFTVTNNSTGDEDGFVDDGLPEEIVFVGFGINELNCVENAGVLRCDFTDLPSGATLTTIVDVYVEEDYCDDPPSEPTVINQAQVATPESVLLDTDLSLVGVLCGPFNVEKFAIAPQGDGMLEGGESFSYQITVTNEGPDTLAGTLDDDLPAPPLEITGGFTTSGPISCVLGDGIIDCEYELEESETATVIIPVRIPEDYCNPTGLQNTVQAYRLVLDQPVVVDRDTIFTEIECADVGIEKSSDEDSYSTGEIVTYTVVVANFGPATAHDVEVFDEHPPGLQFLSASTTQGSCGNEGDHVLCQLGDMDVGPENIVSIELRYRITNQAACDDGNTDNTAVVTASNEGASKGSDRSATTSQGGVPVVQLQTTGGGGHGEANEATASFAVACAPNIVISKTASDVDVGGTITYTISATNIGTETAEGVIVTDDLDDNLTDVSAEASSGSCAVGAGNSFGCDLGEIAIDATETVTITATVPESACPSISNAASGAASNEADGARTDNTDSVTTDIGGCVLGFSTGEAEVLQLAVTGMDLTPLLVIVLLSMLSGAAVLYATRERPVRQPPREASGTP